MKKVWRRIEIGFVSILAIIIGLMLWDINRDDSFMLKNVVQTSYKSTATDSQKSLNLL